MAMTTLPCLNGFAIQFPDRIYRYNDSGTLCFYEQDANGNAVGDGTPVTAQDIADANSAWAYKLVREERDAKLYDCDWWGVSDRTMTADEANYRQALRDVPETQTPEINDGFQLTNITWPTKP